ncbi:MAG: hypothetical protein EA398_12745, partial [Deltaproteobacteria bacterium]
MQARTFVSAGDARARACWRNPSWTEESAAFERDERDRASASRDIATGFADRTLRNPRRTARRSSRDLDAV